MRHLKLLCILLTAVLAAAFCIDASAQFKEEAFTQQYNDDSSAASDSTDVLFSFKEYFGGLRHQNEIRIGTMTAGSALIIGGSQIYNRQTWKLPIVYGTIGGSLGAGIVLQARGNKEAAKAVGEAIAKRALEKGIEEVCFDRGGFLYHGRVKELADGAREAGLKF